MKWPFKWIWGGKWSPTENTVKLQKTYSQINCRQRTICCLCCCNSVLFHCKLLVCCAEKHLQVNKSITPVKSSGIGLLGVMSVTTDNTIEWCDNIQTACAPLTKKAKKKKPLLWHSPGILCLRQHLCCLCHRLALVVHIYLSISVSVSAHVYTLHTETCMNTPMKLSCAVEHSRIKCSVRNRYEKRERKRRRGGWGVKFHTSLLLKLVGEQFWGDVSHANRIYT